MEKMIEKMIEEVENCKKKKKKNRQEAFQKKNAIFAVDHTQKKTQE